MSAMFYPPTIRQIGGAAVRLLAVRAGYLGSTAQSDYKRVALVTYYPFKKNVEYIFFLDV